MTVLESPPAFATAVPAMFEALLDVFAPLDLWLRIDDDSMHIARLDEARSYNTEPLWCDEELTRDALTTCKPDLGADVIAELHDRFRGTTPTLVELEAEGALFHRAAGTDAPAWYGRWRTNTLLSIATVAFRWTSAYGKGFVFRCPASGYPFTASKLLVRGEVGPGDREVAAANRSAILPVLGRVRAALGFDREEVKWDTLGDYGRDYPEDRADIWQQWLPTLRAS